LLCLLLLALPAPAASPTRVLIVVGPSTHPPGSTQLAHAKRFLLTLPWHQLAPATNLCTGATSAADTADGRCALAFAAKGQAVSVDLAKLGGRADPTEFTHERTITSFIETGLAQVARPLQHRQAEGSSEAEVQSQRNRWSDGAVRGGGHPPGGKLHSRRLVRPRFQQLRAPERPSWSLRGKSNAYK
jgi:hypothetical protein